VFFDARDSIEYDLVNRRVRLFGGAKAKYQNIELQAGYIELDWQTNILSADYVPDSVGKPSELPVFKDGNQQFTAHKLKYNFKSKKGVILDARTFESNLHILSAKAKFFGAADSTAHEVVYSRNAIFTTCDAPHPHYGIRSNKQKVIPNKLAVVGPSHLEIMDVPTPLILPFGFYPIFEKRHAGLIFPRDYEYSRELGFGLRNVGYYFPLGPYYDLKLTGDVYMRGSWAVHAHTRYKRRYRYGGEFSLSYATILTERQGELKPEKQHPAKLVWRHNQDTRAHPYQSFSAGVNIESNRFESTTQNHARNVHTNQYSSQVTFRRSFPGTPFSLTAGVGHSQIVSTRQLRLQLPTLDVRMRQIYPLKRKHAIGRERWYEKFSLSYSMQARNEIQTYDSLLLDRSTWQNMKNGVQHRLTTSASYRMLKYFNFTPQVNYTEVWYFRGQDYRFDPTPEIAYDTIYNDDGTVLDIKTDTLRYGHLDTLPFRGLHAVRQFNASVNMSTKLFGMLRLRKGFLRGLRHTVTPSVGFRFVPDFTRAPFNYYVRMQTDTRQAPDEYPVLYRYAGGIYGGPPGSGKQMALTYSISHVFDVKYFSHRDSSIKRTRLFDNITMSGSYNFAADSMRFSKLSVTGSSKLFKSFSRVSVTGVFDPYDTDGQGKAVNRFYWTTHHRLLRFVKLDFRLTTGFSIGQLRQLMAGKEKQGANKKRARPSLHPDRFVSWFDDLRLSHFINVSLRPDGGRVRSVVTSHTVNAQGRLHLTPLWDVRIGNVGYDFKARRLTYPDVGFARNLHCWNMGLSWQPQRGTISFFLKVSSPPLDFLKLPFNRNVYDASKLAF